MPSPRPQATTCPAADAVRTPDPAVPGPPVVAGPRAGAGAGGASGSVPVAGRETRSLPVVAASAVVMPFAVQSYDEVVAHDTTWGEHSHPFHELLWNERGASTAMVGARVRTITPALGLWMPAGTLHSGSAVAGTWFRASFFGSHTTPSISGTPVAVEITPLLRLLLERLGAPGLSPASRVTTEAMVLDVLEPSPRGPRRAGRQGGAPAARQGTRPHARTAAPVAGRTRGDHRR